jgi:uncharacterized repeat protein (TIGR03803 family)
MFRANPSNDLLMMKQTCKNRIIRRAFAPSLAAFFFMLLPIASKGTGLQFSTLHSFDLFLNGAEPYGNLVQGANGLFYGTTDQGGAANAGVVFEVASNGTMSVLYSFTNGVDGGYPEAGLVLGNDGNYYGTTFEGGTNGVGALFKISPEGSFQTLYSFTAFDVNGDNNDGAYPAASLISANDGNLYGTTVEGGANGFGTIFKISTSGSFSLVYAFSALDINGFNSDGASPQAALVQGSDGNFYGTTSDGGSAGAGTVFKYVVSQSTLSPLYSFTGGDDGAGPVAALVQGTNGNYYGTASGGGSNSFGALFEITSGGAFTRLYSFANGADGGDPVAPLALGSDGNFYGTSDGPQNGFGTIFKMTAKGAVQPLYSFTGGNDGAYPLAGLVQAADGSFFGTTADAGVDGLGAVFRITTSGAFSSVMSFLGGGDGSDPIAPLVQASDGNFYGTTLSGGSNSFGALFKITRTGVFTPLYSFANGQDGANPAGGLVQGTDGKLYGASSTGGANGVGVLFKITTNGAFTVLHSLTNLVEGNRPWGLVLGTNGNFYGITYEGGPDSVGEVFQMTPAGTVTPLYAFTNGVDGSYPHASLLQGSDGNFYGTTYLGGTNHHGGIFRITPIGALTPLYSFTNGVDGEQPEGQLCQGTDGNFYGTTSAGGSYSNGTVFELSSAGAFTSLYSFTGGNDGATPVAGLVEGTDHNFYGTTFGGGSNFMGGIFEITSTGTLTTLYAFAGQDDGANPAAALVLGSDGNFYGTASSGDLTGSGTVFRLGAPVVVPPQIISFLHSSNSISFNWSMVSGQMYQVQATTNLTQTPWSDVGSAVTGFNGTSTYLDSTLTFPQRFYRVLTYLP